MHSARNKASLICRSKLIVEYRDVALLGKYNVARRILENTSLASSPVGS